jgi:hypothetical protein
MVEISSHDYVEKAFGGKSPGCIKLQRINMEQHKIDFESIPWTSPMKGVRQKIFKAGNRQLRLVEYSICMSEHWCEKGHIGYVLEGKMEIQFDDEACTYSSGDGIFIPEGKENRHMAKILSDTVTAVFIEDL